MSTRLLCLFVLIIGIASGTKSFAGPIDDLDQTPYGLIRPASAVVLHSDGTSTDFSSVGFDGTGLSDPSPLRGVHSNDFSEMVAVPLDNGAVPVTIQYDLGDRYTVNEMWLWQYNGEGETDRGLKDFDVVFRDHDGTIVSQLAAEHAEQADGLETPPSYFCPTAQGVRYIDLVVRDNHGDTDFVGLSDIAFAGRLRPVEVPEPSGIALAMLFGVLIVARRRRSADSDRSGNHLPMLSADTR